MKLRRFNLLIKRNRLAFLFPIGTPVLNCEVLKITHTIWHFSCRSPIQKIPQYQWLNEGAISFLVNNIITVNFSSFVIHSYNAISTCIPLIIMFSGWIRCIQSPNDRRRRRRRRRRLPLLARPGPPPFVRLLCCLSSCPVCSSKSTAYQMPNSFFTIKNLINILLRPSL